MPEMTSNSSKYAGKVILAPMVKIGTLPTRVLALRYGADLVYSEEIIDHKFLQATRVVNDVTGTIDYLDVEGTVFFQTCEEERSKVILQIGTCDPDRALQVAKLTEGDIAGIDINMGCPKGFSLKGGMGAALLKQPEKIKSILTTLVSNLKIPVTCKIRVLPTLEATLSLCKMIESCGVAAIGVHGRTKDERQQHKNRNDFLRAIANELKIPVIANGGSKEIKVHLDIQKFREDSGCSSVMLARAAEWNISIFADKEKEDIHEIIRKFIKLAVDFNLCFPNIKYTIQCILRELQDSPFGRQFLATQITEEICKLWELSDYYQEKQKEHKLLAMQRKRKDSSVSDCDSESKKSRIESSKDGSVIVVPNCVYLRGHYEDVEVLPKTILLKWSKKNMFSRIPVYTTEGYDKKFRSTVTLGGQVVRTDVWEKNKKCAEQGAALACIKYLGIIDN